MTRHRGMTVEQSPGSAGADRTEDSARAQADALNRLRQLVTEGRQTQGSGDASLERALAIVCDALQSPLGKVLELTSSGELLAMRAGIGWSEGVVSSAVVTAGVTSTAG